MLILKTLQWGEQHGYGISQSIRAISGDVLQVETGSLYPALHRLERQHWVCSQWKKSDANQRAKFYHVHHRASARRSWPLGARPLGQNGGFHLRSISMTAASPAGSAS